MASLNLAHHFLAAMPGMNDPHFFRALTYICEHNENGTYGLIVNRPTDMTVGMLFERVQLTSKSSGESIKIPINEAANAMKNGPVYFGGPVQTDHGFVLHRPAGNWENTILARDDIAVTCSLDILRSISDCGIPRDTLFTLGYAGWGPRQLEDEIMQNGWLTIPAEPDIIFNVPPEKRFNAALAILGVHPESLVADIGHT